MGMIENRLGEALRIVGNADTDSLTSQAMAGKRAIHAITSDLPTGPQKTALIAETGAAMQDQLIALREGKARIDEAYTTTLRKLDDFATSQPSLDEMIATAKAELDSER